MKGPGTKQFGGRVLFLDRDDINTDEIIPARYLTASSREELKPHILEDLQLPGFDPPRDCAGRGAVVSRKNFGCGSSREHAPWVLELNGINMVIAESFARIFRQNMYNCGLIAAELPRETLDALFRDFAGQETTLTCPAAANGETRENLLLTFTAKNGDRRIERICPFVLGGFERTLVESGGWVEYANRRY
ncbi:MAG: 3-isopropylmalate dehydratase small subunit [Treponema sp.]|jgi:3-isopropylmalate/(R)-2-methylmalate dehydratase small subunit|nr:3-isopropylmalate dehydratase small subunit [Treponema sp.]